MNAWASQHVRAARDALRRLVHYPLASLLTVAVIAIALSLPAALYFALARLQGMSRQLAADPQVSVFLALDATPADAETVEARLRERAEVASVQFVARDQALAQLTRSGSLEDVLGTLERNPLPDAFVVTVRGNRPAALESLRDLALTWPKVEHAQVDSEWARKLDATLRVSRTFVLLIGVLLGCGLIAVTFNTIRLQILTRREEIEVSKLIGATNGFIRRPFLYFGAIQGVIGGAGALAVVALGASILNRSVTEWAALYASELRLTSLPLTEAIVLICISGLLGWLGAWLSASRHLWRMAES